MVSVAGVPVTGETAVAALFGVLVVAVAGMFVVSWLKRVVFRLTLHHLVSAGVGAVAMDLLHEVRPLGGRLVGLLDGLTGVIG